MPYAAATDKIWPVPPDWRSGVQERLSWLTDLMQANATAVSQHRGVRTGPRRRFTFEVLADGQARRVADMLLAGHRGAWQLPIWPDVQWLGAPLAAGAVAIPCETAGYDFVVGGRALLYSSVNRWELVQIDTIAADHITLSAPTTLAYGRGDRLYPVRRAWAQDGAEETLHNDELGRRSLAFDIDEPCDWPVLSSPTEYLTHPVLDVRPDESDDPSSSASRLVQTVDYASGLPFRHDLAGLSLRAQQSHWKLVGRAEHSWYRSLLYALRGRQVPIWVPSWAADLKPVSAIAGGSMALSVEWAGYTLFGLGKHNRKDLRIELNDGTVYYRRVTNAVEAGGTEALTLNATLSGSSIAAGSIRQVSFMALSTLASDEIEIEHETDADGIATSTTGWQAVVPDV
ncbi:hypothetical protein [Lysobacter olei]